MSERQTIADQNAMRLFFPKLRQDNTPVRNAHDHVTAADKFGCLRLAGTAQMPMLC